MVPCSVLWNLRILFLEGLKSLLRQIVTLRGCATELGIVLMFYTVAHGTDVSTRQQPRSIQPIPWLTYSSMGVESSCRCLQQLLPVQSMPTDSVALLPRFLLQLVCYSCTSVPAKQKSRVTKEMELRTSAVAEGMALWTGQEKPLCAHHQ